MKSGLPGNPSLLSTTENNPFFWKIVFCFTVVHFLFAVFFPPFEDELYYWAWSQRLALSYYDHPPLVAYCIFLSSKVFGNNLFGIRFFAVLFSTGIVLLLKNLTRGFSLFLLLLLSPIFFWGSVLMTPDAPFFFFWTCYLVTTIRIAQKMSSWGNNPIDRVYQRTPVPYGDWLLLGLFLGLGNLSKYSMILCLPCSFISFLSAVRFRSWVQGYVIHLFVAAIVSLPIIIFNWQHDFASFQFQYYNALSGTGQFSFSNLIQFFSSQILLFGALPFLFLPYLFMKWSKIREDPVLMVCFYFFSIPLLIFVYLSLRQKLEANWGLFMFLSFWPLAQTLLDRNTHYRAKQILLFISFILPIAVSFIFLIHLNQPFKRIAPRKDRLSRMAPMAALLESWAAQIKNTGLPLFASNYQITSYFRYFGTPAEQIHPGGRQSEFTLHTTSPCQFPKVLYFSEGEEDLSKHPTLSCFPKNTLKQKIPLVVRGEETQFFYLYEAEKE